MVMRNFELRRRHFLMLCRSVKLSKLNYSKYIYLYISVYGVSVFQLRFLSISDVQMNKLGGLCSPTIIYCVSHPQKSRNYFATFFFLFLNGIILTQTVVIFFHSLLCVWFHMLIGNNLSYRVTTLQIDQMRQKTLLHLTLTHYSWILYTVFHCVLIVMNLFDFVLAKHIVCSSSLLVDWSITKCSIYMAY